MTKKHFLIIVFAVVNDEKYIFYLQTVFAVVHYEKTFFNNCICRSQ